MNGGLHSRGIIKHDNILYVSCPALVSYPNAFRMITVTNYRNKTVVNVEDKETRLKNIQKLAKLLIFSGNVYTGEEKDRNATITIKR